MKISVIGPGAMGCLFAAKLQEAGNKVSLVDYRPDRVQRLSSSGITVEGPKGEIKSSPAVVLEVPAKQDLVIILTKSYSLEGLRLPPDTAIMTLQNGLGNSEVLAALVGSSHVLTGVTSEAATLLEEGKVRHTASGVTKIGAWTSCATEEAEAALNGAGFETEISDSPGQMVWEKVAINSGINSLTALLNVPNGRLLEVTEIRQLMRDLVVEGAKVAATEGYRFEHSLVELAEEICAQTRDNISSMLQDVRAGKRTENESISGEILRRGEIASLPTPRTRMVWQLIKGLEQR